MVRFADSDSVRCERQMLDKKSRERNSLPAHQNRGGRSPFRSAISTIQRPRHEPTAPEPFRDLRITKRRTLDGTNFCGNRSGLHVDGRHHSELLRCLPQERSRAPKRAEFSRCGFPHRTQPGLRAVDPHRPSRIDTSSEPSAPITGTQRPDSRVESVVPQQGRNGCVRS